jgi:hypothetical protein
VAAPRPGCRRTCAVHDGSDTSAATGRAAKCPCRQRRRTTAGCVVGQALVHLLYSPLVVLKISLARPVIFSSPSGRCSPRSPARRPKTQVGSLRGLHLAGGGSLGSTADVNSRRGPRPRMALVSLHECGVRFRVGHCANTSS